LRDDEVAHNHLEGTPGPRGKAPQLVGGDEERPRLFPARKEIP
jgi:hypothetical protein